ncbi:prepilin-type N-terminal cleavage/methylation domain-containing protein [Candidatus Daviesbacteria bacterium]|nr:prepilin-type N-terminal cleavage/methylation domain-containing protein [Candidatus Daviesbacteria bacterium]
MNFFRKNLFPQRGFSLIEIMLAISTISILIILIASFPNAINLVTKSQHQSLAREIISKQIEDLRSLSYINLSLGETQLLDSRLSLLPNGNGKVLVESCDGTTCSNNEKTKKITVRVSWKEGSRTQDVNVSTLISEGGLSK